MSIQTPRRFRQAPPRKKQHRLPNWLTVPRLIGLAMASPFILVLAFMTLIWGYDQLRHGSLYAMCDELPVGAEFVPLKRQIFMDGCYTPSVCRPDHYRTSKALVRYEITSLQHCLKPRVLRPDRAVRRFVYNLTRPEPKPQLPEYTPIETTVEMASTS